MFWGKLQVLCRIFLQKVCNFLPLFISRSTLRLICLFLLDFCFTPNNDLLIVATRSKNTVFSKLRISPSYFPDRPRVAIIPSQDLLTLPFVILNGKFLILIIVNFMPYFDFLVRATSGHLISIEVKLHIMHKIVMAKSKRTYQLIIHFCIYSKYYYFIDSI